LYHNDGKEHLDAYHILLHSGIPFEQRPHAPVERPVLSEGLSDYIGLEEIQEFIEKHRRSGSAGK
jgi:hypothetical protein